MIHQPDTEQQVPTDHVSQLWDALATDYDEHVTPTHMPLANQALDHIDIKPGMRFLDVAAGSGSLGLAAAQRGADVLGTDISPAMIERLNANAHRSGLANLTGRVMDGHTLELEDDAFDASGSMFGVMLFPDLPRGLREMARVTAPGGKVLMVTFGPPQAIEFLGFFLAAAKRTVPDFAGLPMNPPPLPFQVSDPEKLHQAMRHAGLDEVRVERTTEIQEFASAEHLCTWVASSNPIGAKLVGSLSPEQRAAVRTTLDAMLLERSGGTGPARLTNPINIAVGTAS